MNLTQFTDYALRTLIYVGLHEAGRPSIKDVSDAFGISRNHLLKVVQQLGQLGFLETTRGRNGGLSLGKPAAEIKIGDVVRRTEPGFDLVECFDSVNDRCKITPHCKLKGALHRALRAFLGELDGITLADMLTERARLATALEAPSRATTLARRPKRPR
jgi:Rrf2 family transcriptional regulator, nitric oxide-sensitive transcriptional repressor